MDIQLFSGRSSHGWIFLAAAMILITGACKKTSSGESNEQNLQKFFSSSGQYTLFNRALQRTHLDSLLGATNPYTVFAVNDSAMTQAGYSAAGIDTAEIGALTGILRYHLVPGSIASTDVNRYAETILTTADHSYNAYLEYNNFGLFYNGIPLVSIDNKMVNGVVQGIQSMAMPPTGDLVYTISKTPGLSDFSYVVANAENTVNLGNSYNVIIPYITGTPAAPITVFLPDNKYFASLGLDNYYAILNSNTQGPKVYMTQGEYFISDFIGKNAIDQYFGVLKTSDQLWFSQDGTSFVSYLNNAVGANSQFRIVRSNIIATNGIIHVIEPY